MKPDSTSALSTPEPRRRSLHPAAELLIAFMAGLIFAAGLTMSGMTQPDKVIALLDIKEMLVGPFPGRWDGTLLFVALGALLIALLGYAVTPRASVRPWFTRSFVLTTGRHSDGRLIAGALLFGVGWGLSGYSPATALTSLLTGQLDTVIFVLAMLPGMWVARKL
ncbi:MAG: DUF6691 family protein [Betaproteobacteria bacterium]